MNIKDINIVFLILLLLIVSFSICSLLNKKEYYIEMGSMENFQDSESDDFFNRNNQDNSSNFYIPYAGGAGIPFDKLYGGCGFIPKGKTKLACVDRCRNPVDRFDWGGDNCTRKICNVICSDCSEPEYCNWLKDDDNDIIDIRAPGKPLITLQPKKNSAILYWMRPKSSSPIFEYSIIVESDNFPEKVRINTYNDSNSINCEYELFNIINYRIKKNNEEINTTYNIYIIAKNKYGHSEKSNVIKYTPLTTDSSFELKQQINDLMERNKLSENKKNYIYNYDRYGNITSVRSIKYTPKQENIMFKKLVNDDLDSRSGIIEPSYDINLT